MTPRSRSPLRIQILPCYALVAGIGLFGCDTSTGPTVDPLSPGLLVHPSGVSLEIGESQSLTVDFPGASSTESVRWSISNPAVATIDETGVVTAVRDGQTGVRAQADGRVARGLVTVTAPAAEAVAEIHAAEHPYPPGDVASDLYEVWGAESNDVFAVGAGGTVIHWDGTRWTAMQTPTEKPLRALWGTTGEDVFAASEDSLFHYDGDSWRPIGSTGDVPVTDLTGSASNELFAVGDHLFVRYDGTRWETLSSDDFNFYWPPSYGGVWAAYSGDVYAVGRGYRGSDGVNRPLMVRYDGSEVTRVDLPTNALRSTYDDLQLADVRGTAPDAIVAVGAVHHANENESGPYALHYNGEEWTEMSVADGLAGSFHDVWGSASGQWFAVGGRSSAGLIARFDGSVWRHMASDHRQLHSIWGARQSAIFAVGEEGLALHYDGSDWRQVETPAMPQPHPLPEADLWGAAPDNVFAVGSGGNILHFDGSEWREQESGTELDLHGVWGASATDVYAVGDEGIILRWDGQAWSIVRSGGESLTDVWGVTHDRIFAVGENGRVLWYDGAEWQQIGIGTSANLRAVWGTAPDDILVAGDQGSLFRYDGEGWRDLNGSGGARHNAIWGTGASHIYVAGEEIREDGGAGGFVLLHTGGGWSRVSGPSLPYYDLWGTAADDLYATGADGWILRHDGTHWVHLRRWTGERIRAVWGTAESPPHFLVEEPAAIFYGVR